MWTTIKRHNNRRGASAVEFAIILPLFIAFVFGIIEFGLLMKDSLTCSHAAREAARLGSVMPTFNLSDVVQKALDTAVGIPISTDDIIVDYYDEDQSGWVAVTSDTALPSGSKIRVRVTYDHPLVTSFILKSGTTRQVVGCVIMRRE